MCCVLALDKCQQKNEITSPAIFEQKTANLHDQKYYPNWMDTNISFDSLHIKMHVTIIE